MQHFAEERFQKLFSCLLLMGIKEYYISVESLVLCDNLRETFLNATVAKDLKINSIG